MFDFIGKQFEKIFELFEKEETSSKNETLNRFLLSPLLL